MKNSDYTPPGIVSEASTGLVGQYEADVSCLSVNGKTVILIGTAHVSQESVDLVKLVIEQEHPDRVCVELDAKRFEAISHPNRWESLDLKEIIRKQQLSTLMVNLILSSFQKRLGDKLGVIPGTEMLEAIRMADKHDIPVTLADRDVRVTMRRAWRNTPFWRKSLLMSSLMLSIFDTTEVSEEEIRNLKKQDVLSEMMKDLGKEVPTLKTVLIDERDHYLAKKIADASGTRIVAVVGAGHVEGICRTLHGREQVDLEELESIQPVSPVWKAVGWSIPVLIVGSIAWIGWQKGLSAAGENLMFWILANGIPSGIGGLLAMAHPLTIAAAFISAPFTSLTPVIGVGYVTAFVQAYLQPPLVREFQTVAEDIAIPRRWWKSRLLRVFLAFLLPTIGSLIGTWVGGTRIVSNLF
ncbi:TraB/GumN family protein [Candidatus Nitrospira allomarina]|uniref:TraB/GumN family protein n=1 Tax=Candidatus Nitrospira allomarina TaxID=3020900 RepID=A0AA96GJ68_9BACT|nr:TraB/GumN family protein [Candidatus Nitrospira allomarina]WNM58646.1 TraB/GumN family protein [Candidatus Nitrospira allomarina]